MSIVLIISTRFITIVGINLILALREMRKTFRSVNRIVGEFGGMGKGLENGLGEIVGFMKGAKLFIKAIDLASKKDIKHPKL